MLELRHLFLWSSDHSVEKKKSPNCGRSVNDGRKVVKSKDLRRQTKEGWPFFHKLCEKYSRKSRKYMRNNSTKRKGKKNSTSRYRSKFRAQRYGDKLPKKSWKALKRKRRCTLHASMVSTCQLYTKGGPAGKLMWCEPLETIWIIVDETTYKDPAPKTLDELRQWLRFAWKNVTLDTLWELVHSIPHRLEIVRKHTGRRSGY